MENTVLNWGEHMQPCEHTQISTHAHTHIGCDIKHSSNPLEDYKPTYPRSAWICQLQIPLWSCCPFTPPHAPYLKKNKKQGNRDKTLHTFLTWMYMFTCFLWALSMLRLCSASEGWTGHKWQQRRTEWKNSCKEKRAEILCQHVFIVCSSSVEQRNTLSEWVMTHMILTLITSVYVISSPSIPIRPPLVLGMGCRLVCQK